jgi:hypothetical protein
MSTEELEKYIQFSTQRPVIKIKYVRKEKKKPHLCKQNIMQTVTSV